MLQQLFILMNQRTFMKQLIKINQSKQWNMSLIQLEKQDMDVNWLTFKETSH
jgi:hypothetical protein